MLPIYRSEQHFRSIFRKWVTLLDVLIYAAQTYKQGDLE